MEEYAMKYKSSLAALLLLLLPIQEASADWNINQAWDTLRGKEEKTAASAQIPDPEKQAAAAAENDKRFLAVWDDVIKKLDQGLDIVEQMTAAPEKTFFGADKADLRQDLNTLLDGLILLLEDQPISSFRARTVELEEYIERQQENIRAFQEAKITAPEKTTFKSSRKDYDEKILEARKAVRLSEREIEEIRKQLHKRILTVGLEMDESQVAILLSRVDADDIIQMAAIFDITRQLTNQLMKLTAESGEKIDNARRYYGMYVVLLELTVRMQQNYILAVNEQYTPRLSLLAEKTLQLNQASKQQLQTETDNHRIQVYKNNIKAQELTLKTAQLYMDNLRNQRNRVRTAMEEMQRNLILAHNTYDTVLVSAELLELLQQSSSSFDSLMNLQIPEIIPFENQEMLSKYQELSRMISR